MSRDFASILRSFEFPTWDFVICNIYHNNFQRKISIYPLKKLTCCIGLKRNNTTEAAEDPNAINIHMIKITRAQI